MVKNFMDLTMTSNLGRFAHPSTFKVAKQSAVFCPKMKINGKKSSKLQFYFSELLIACPMLKI